MKVVIAGAGAVGRSIAQELLRGGHVVALIERHLENIEESSVPSATWVHGDACELDLLEQAQLQDYEVVIAATGDDKANLVFSLLSKTEFGVRRVVARVNDPRNEWLFDNAWGVDVAVSTPRLLASLAEEAVSVGDLVRLMTLRQGQANLVEITLPTDTALAGRAVSTLVLPRDVALVTILRGGRVIVPQPDDPLEGEDELLFVAAVEAEEELRHSLVTEPSAAPPA
ncbi:MAG: TrkA family potassium uptake protein [Nocardia sp.]|nr:TrkA family potassium uptake protein [Nocardia sp.]